MGWNLVELPEDMDLFADLGPAKHFYFAHSFQVQVQDPQAKIAYTDYGFPLTASIQKANIYGVQFHPEKSGPQGLQVLKNFHAICAKR
jgi:glutamine amidotransferase